MFKRILSLFGICKHDWSKWEITEQGNINTYYGDAKLRTGIFIDQKRICKLCGYTQINSKKESI